MTLLVLALLLLVLLLPLLLAPLLLLLPLAGEAGDHDGAAQLLLRVDLCWPRVVR